MQLTSILSCNAPLLQTIKTITYTYFIAFALTLFIRSDKSYLTSKELIITKCYLCRGGLTLLAKDLNEGRDGSRTRAICTKLSSLSDVRRDRRNFM